MKLNSHFFKRDGLLVAKELLGKLLCIEDARGILKYRITETELYSGEGDSACHAHKGKTPRSQVLYREGGTLYIYLCYGIHNLMNIVTGKEGYPEAVLLRGIEGYGGPGKLTRALGITRELNDRPLEDIPHLWIEDDGYQGDMEATPRIGISYADPEDQQKLWRFVLK